MQPSSQKQLMPNTFCMPLRSSHPKQVQVRSTMPVVRYTALTRTFGDFKDCESETSPESLVFEDHFGGS